MAHAYQFVDSIDPDVATILLDLDNSDPFEVNDGTVISPPAMRRASSTTMLRDGAVTSGTAYEGRTIKLVLRVLDVHAEAQAAAVQTLARILNSRSTWLKWQPEGLASPVYFRTERCSFDILDEWQTDRPRRTLELEIPADPFAYGEKVSGQFTVDNDSFVVPWSDTVEGDVAAPLALSFEQPAVLKDYTVVASSQARDDGVLLSVPFLEPLSGSGSASVVSGWAVADSADASTIGGTKRRIARAVAGAVSSQPVTPNNTLWSDLPQGEYRVMVRARLVTGGTSTKLSFYGGALGVAGHVAPQLDLTIRNAPAADAYWDWYDLGVVAMPAGSPPPDNVFGTAAPTALSYWSLWVTSAAVTTIDFDSVLLVPVGTGPHVVLSRWSVSQAPATAAARDIYLDGVTDRRYFDQAGLLGNFDAIAGDLPVLVPGAANTLHLMIATAVNTAGTYTGHADVASASTVVDYAYYPRYISGFRPAGS